MKTVFKYPIPATSKSFSEVLPRGFKFLRMLTQNGTMCMWLEVDKDAIKDQINFELFGTGQDIPVHAKYLSTYDVGPFVLHLYQL